MAGYSRQRAGLALLAALTSSTLAHPYPRNDLQAVGFDYLLARDCATYCGADDQYCCGSGETCFTTNNIAGCSASNGDGHGVYITTWTQTQTFTSTVSTSWAAAETGSGDGSVCEPADGTEVSCGSVCCASWQYCAYKGQCYSRDDASVPVSTYTTNGQLTTRFSQAYRITSTAGAGASGTAVAAGDNNGNGGDDGNEGGLSDGAIAGIVIGSLLGVALLILLCFCCIARGLWALLCGGRGRDRDSEQSRRNSRSGATATTGRGTSTHSRRQQHRTWYGKRVSSPSGRRGSTATKEKGENKILLALTAIVSTLAALLFLKRKKKNNQQSEKSRSTTTTTSRPRGNSRRGTSRGYTDSWSGSDSDRSE